MSDKLEYGAVSVIDASTSLDPNVSWVQAHIMKEEQEEETSSQPKYNDVPFSILFYIHLAIFAFTAVFYGSWDNLVSDEIVNGWVEVEESSIEIRNIMVYLVLPCGIAAFTVPSFFMGVLIPRFPKGAVIVSLLSSMFVNVIIAFALFASYPTWWMFLLSFGLVAWSFWYVRAIQIFIPYAAATLKLGVRGVTANWGMYIVSLVLSALGVVWVGAWVYVANGVGLWDVLNQASTTSGVGVQDQDQANTSVQDGEYYDYPDTTSISIMAFVLLLSLYWTSTVLTNISQTTVAGVIGTWCFDKASASSFCSSAVTQSLYRSCTSSFGSICFGSLLNAIVITLRVLANYAEEQARSEGDQTMALIFCVLQCILSILEDILEYFNQWSYTFVGIYGMSYLESGKAVLELFKARGCTAILTNGLAMYVLNSVVIFTGVACGVIAMIFASVINVNIWCAFWVALIGGVIIASTMANTIQGAVKGVIVCYADHPGKMYENHPNEMKELSDAIALVFPEVQVFACGSSNFIV